MNLSLWCIGFVRLWRDGDGIRSSLLGVTLRSLLLCPSPPFSVLQASSVGTGVTVKLPYS
jgi:hypothetical protein